MTPPVRHPLLPMHSALLAWYAQNGRKDFPWRRLRKPFAILLAEVLLQRTSAGTVANYFPKIYARLPTVEHLQAMAEGDLQDVLKPLGLFQRRARHLKDLANDLQERFRGKVPRTYEKLTSLMGLGDYIPRAVLCFAWGQRVAVVDLNVIRIYARMFSIQPKSREDPRRTPEIIRLAEDLLPPKEYVKKYSWALLDLGALVCKFSGPLCEQCPISAFCDFYKNLAKDHNYNLE
jgi:A/G-specific adenine glycosylase